MDVIPPIVARTPQQLGALVKRARMALQLTQTDLADRTGLQQYQISKIEDGASGTRIDTILRVLGAIKLEILVQRRMPADPTETD